MFQGISLKRREREKTTWGKLVFPGTGPSFIFQESFLYFWLNRDQWIIQSYAGSAALTLIKTRLSFCKSFCIQRVSGDLHYLLAKRPVNILWLFSLIYVNQPENSFFLEVFFPLICITFKVLNKVTLKEMKTWQQVLAQQCNPQSVLF